VATEPLRLRILKKLSSIIETASFSYAYEENPAVDVSLVGKVFRGRVIFGDSDPLPMVSILEVPLPLDQVPSPSESPASTGRWELLLQGFVEDDHLNPTDPAHWLMAQVKAALATERRKMRDFQLFDMGKHVLNIFVGPGVVRPPDEMSAKAYFWLTVTLELAEDLSDPFED
jgi:hypothetical protein